VAPTSEPHDATARLVPAAGPATWWTVARSSAAECLLASVLLIAVVTIVRWVAGPSPASAAIHQVHAKLLVIGGCVGLVLAGLILSPPGKASGAHISPGISIAMWRFGLFPGASVTPYVAVPPRPPALAAPGSSVLSRQVAPSHAHETARQRNVGRPRVRRGGEWSQGVGCGSTGLGGVPVRTRHARR
jgi:Major intrinsic protein